MPSYMVHLAIANEYLKKHKNEIKNKEEFIFANIAPDLAENKEKSHFYIKNTEYTDYERIIKDNKLDLKSDYGKGYFLHLLADETFYYYYFKKEYQKAINEESDLYCDWDAITKSVINDYKIKYIPDEIKEFASREEQDKKKYLDYKKIKRYIKQFNKFSLNDQINNISKNNKILVNNI